MLFRRIAAVAVLGTGLCCQYARAQSDDGSMSKGMRRAVELFEKGEDIEAMDQFMDILTSGEPGERSTANEYINLITHRMNAGGGVSAEPPVPKGRPPAPAGKPESAGAEPVEVETARPDRGLDEMDRERPGGRRTEPTRARDEEMPAANKALMRKEIRSRLRAAVEKSLADLRGIDGARVISRENGDPAAVALPTSALFQEGIAFQPGASKILDPLTRLVFALGTAQAVILPEGTSVGDAKVLDMRRTMGISAHLFNAGVAPPRVRVNLLNTQVDIPKALTDYKGVVIVFVYNQPLNLTSDGAVAEDQGPPLSLGVYPSALRPARGQGVIVEFSVSDPPAGLVSWKFQLLQPSLDGAELAPLQDVVGGGPVFHQIFWNGKQNYFGEPLPPGRYECVLTATDAKSRQRSVHRWIQVLADEQAPKPAAERKGAETKSEAEAAPSKSAASALAPSADLSGEEEKPLVADVKPEPKGVEIQPRAAAPKAKRPIAKRPARAKAAPAEPAAESEEEPRAPNPGATEWALKFDKGTYQLTAESEKLLAAAAAATGANPGRLRVVGHSAAEESDGAALAGQRAKMVAGILVNRYQVDSKRIFMTSSASGEGNKVDLALAKAQ